MHTIQQEHMANARAQLLLQVISTDKGARADLDQASPDPIEVEELVRWESPETPPATAPMVPAPASPWEPDLWDTPSPSVEQPVPKEDWEDCFWATPSPSQSMDPLSQVSTDDAGGTPLLELAPGMTVAACGRAIAQWNSLAHPTQQLHSGSSAAELLSNALAAESRLLAIANAASPEEAHGYCSTRARAALTAALPNRHPADTIGRQAKTTRDLSTDDTCRPACKKAGHSQ